MTDTANIEVVISRHDYRIQALAAEHRAQIRATVAVRRAGLETVVWSHSSTNGPFGPNHIMPAAREFAADLAETLGAHITEVEQ